MDDNLITIRVNDTEKRLLEKLAIENNLYKKNNEPSLGLALKSLIKNKLNQESNGVNSLDIAEDINKIKKLSEQINAVIPQLFFNSSFASNAIVSSLSNEKYDSVYKNTIEKSSQVVGQLQENKYEEVYPAKDKKNMTILPIEEYKNKWK